MKTPVSRLHDTFFIRKKLIGDEKLIVFLILARMLADNILDSKENASQLVESSSIQLVDGGGALPIINGLYIKDLSERGTFFMLEVYKRVGISRVEVQKRAQKLSFGC